MSAETPGGPWWRCWICSLGFLHARYLARHLMDVHGEPRHS